MSAGFWSGCDGKKSTPACWATVLSWSMAAGRYTSQETVSTFFLRFSRSHLEILPTVVVLPAPCRPAIRMMAGGCEARSSSAVSPPIRSTMALWTMPTSAWPGVSDCSTSWPSAFSFTWAMKSRTTGRATSASSRAMRISRNISWVLASVRRASPRMVFTMRARRWERLSNMRDWARRRWKTWRGACQGRCDVARPVPGQGKLRQWALY